MVGIVVTVVTYEEVVAGGALVAVVAVPVSAPTNVVAVTTPVKVPLPVTVRALVGFVVPIPTLESV